MAELRDEKLDFWLKHNLNVLLIGPHGVGKCLAKGTPVLMYDGTIRLVEKIRNGDYLMGTDSTPRVVQGISHGRQAMYKIIPTKGDPFSCNEEHILSLKLCSDLGKDLPKNKIIDISVKDYLEKSKWFQRRAMLFRTSVDFNGYRYRQTLRLPPYLLGLWLGDGTTAKARFATADIDILDYLCDYANKNDLIINQTGDIDFDITSGQMQKGDKRNGRNALLSMG